MRKKFEKQLEDLNNELIQMGSLIEQAIEMAISGLVNQDMEKAGKTKALAEEIKILERDIQSLCFQIMLSQQPVASDLRKVTAAMKMVTDMSRIGDQADDIAEISTHLAGEEYIKKMEHLPLMAKETVVMVINSIDAYVKADIILAGEVIRSDDIVDNLFIEVKNELIGLIHKDAGNGAQATDLLMIAKYFERIGDHAVNIAEWVIFSVTGKMYDESNLTK